MRLADLLDALPADALLERPADDPVIRGLSYDSRAAAAGDLFFAWPGSRADGHEYVAQAVGLGAVAVVAERRPAEAALRGRALALVRDSRGAMAKIARRFYGDPAAELRLVGVTGTNGKTSTTYLVESMLARAGQRVGLVGTVEVRHPGERRRAQNTTPESLDLQRTLRSMRTHGVEAVVMEVSSHGLELGRVEGCRFDVGAFTNLTQDHLDFHRTMDAYLGSKALLFERHLRPGAAAVVNADDPSAGAFEAAARAAGARLVRVSRRDRGCEVWLEAAAVGMDGTRARLRLPSGPLDVALPLLGDFNLENLLVATGIAVALGVAPEAIAAGARGCPQVPGRVERIEAGEGPAPTVLVDYAHTPDALEKLLRTLRPLARGRLLAVFGCGGDRDKAKRPLMAEAVARYCDRAIATSDNPRGEDPLAILADVEQGLAKLRRVEPEALDAAEHAYCVIVDRRSAIDLAIRIARAGDTLVLAGKGHEDYQIIGSERLPFSDCDEARRALRRRAAR
jgi:UDP-N-acetylmuramoyl-L-alanyl-D-glutamate--2,6-diaminopimelate ligase